MLNQNQRNGSDECLIPHEITVKNVFYYKVSYYIIKKMQHIVYGLEELFQKKSNEISRQFLYKHL